LSSETSRKDPQRFAAKRRLWMCLPAPTAETARSILARMSSIKILKLFGFFDRLVSNKERMERDKWRSETDALGES
jgi:hypothetical protein